MANDCVPQTFATMSGLTKTKKSFGDWSFVFARKKLEMPVTLDDGLKTWAEQMPSNKTHCVYSTTESRLTDKDWKLEERVPLFWFGKLSPALAQPSAAPDQFHCAIAVFFEGRFYLVHTFSENSRPYVEEIDTKNFFEQTIEIYRVEGVSKVQLVRGIFSNSIVVN